jgi:eukaryotic-like serine/threonine-protein kinase
MADVYLAYDKVLDRPVAIKLLKARYAQDDAFVERFRREARSAAALANPYIVPIFDWGEAEDGTYYIVMEYVPGGDLKDRLKVERRLSPRTATAMALQVAEALQAAHKRGIIHRDVKPRNILIAGSEHIKVADFGIARATEATTISHPDDILGSVKYMSPEQASGEQVGPGSDLYSLGVVLYETLTGRVPFDVTTPPDVPAEHANGPPPHPRNLNPEVPEEIDAMVMKLLSRDPTDRHGSATEVVEDLRRVRDGLSFVSPSATETPFAASTEAPTRTIKPAASDSASGRATGTPRRRTLWVLIPLLVLAGALGLVGWDLFRDAIPGGLPGDSGGAAGKPERDDGRAPTDQAVEVPAVTGLREQVARERLDQAGLQVEVSSRESSEEDAGRVLEQSVASGQSAKEGSQVVLTVGKVSRVARVPDLVGLNYSEAEVELERAGFLLGGVQQVASETVPAGVIARQDPQSGSTLERGSYVYLTTSTGPSAGTTQGF